MDADGIAVRLYLCRVEERLLTYAQEARRLRADLDALGYVDESAAMRRGAMLAGLGEYRKDDVRVLMPRTRAGRALVWVARVALTLARALG